MERERSRREYDHGERDTRDRERSSRSGRDRDYEKESRDKTRDRETSTSPKTRERERERHREMREREKNRDRDRERDRERDSRDRDSYDRPRDRDSRDRERDRDRDRERERDRERDREARDRPSSSSGVAFSRPATYDPRLAQRTQLRNQRNSNSYDDDDLRYEDTVRRKQLKDELGLSDDDQDTPGDGSDEDSAHGRKGKSKATRNGTGGGAGAGNFSREMLEQLEKLQRELEIARENEQKAHDSLSNLQLLSKSQTAILKTTMTKKIQEKQDLLEEMTGTIKDLEAKLYTAGIEFEAYSAPLVKSSSLSSSTSGGGPSTSEADAIAEIGAMKSEIDRLVDENKTLKAAAAATASAANGKTAVASSANESSPKKEDQASKAKLEAVEAEKRTLAQQLKETQQKLADLKATAPPIVQLSAPPVPPAESSSNVEELRALQKKVRSVDLALLSSLSILRALVLILCLVPC